MKKVIFLAIFFIAALGYAQENEPTYERVGDLVKATYYHQDGAVSVQGFFKDKKLSGEWTSFDKEGNKTQKGQYKEGKKIGKWFLWDKESLKEINYTNNTIASVQEWKSESKLAFNNK